jgi:YD repeat-containing protein
MAGKTYTITAPHAHITWKFTYDLAGNLTSFEFLEGALTEGQIKWLFTENHFPYNEQRLKEVYSKHKNFTLTYGAPDLSFNTFWDAYDKKEKRKVTKAIWDKMKEVDKIAALRYIKRYNYKLKINGTAKAYPDTFLNQQRWTDE